MFWNNLPQILIFIAFSFHKCVCNDLKQKMIDFGIVPRIVPVAPQHPCRIFYPFQGEMVEITTGERVYANLTKKEPVIKWPIREGKLYSLFMGGLAPIYDLAFERNWDKSLGDQVDQQWDNWIVVNIPGTGRKIDFGDELVSYYHLPIPFKNTTDKISFWVWEQPKKFENPVYERGIENRNRFGDRYMIQTFTKQFGLGDPWAGNFFILLHSI